MGDSRRFDRFAAKIKENLNPDWKIADVAGGKGFLRLALAEKGFKDVETWDKMSPVERLKHLNLIKER